jgi:hypothetical protein
VTFGSLRCGPQEHITAARISRHWKELVEREKKLGAHRENRIDGLSGRHYLGEKLLQRVSTDNKFALTQQYQSDRKFL